VTRNARVVYADNDPVVLAHAGALLTSDPGTAVVAADIRDPDALLAAPASAQSSTWSSPSASC
jgi:hypothetical protein